MDLLWFRYFVAVAEEQNFTKAGQRFGLSQPPLSRHIQELEEYIGAELFSRDYRHVELTRVGRRFLPEARAAIAQFDFALEVIKRDSGGEDSVVNIAISGGLGDILEKVVPEYKKCRSGVKLAYKDISSNDQAAALRERKVDIGFSRSEPDQTHLHAAFLLSEPIVALLPPGHPFHQRECIKLNDIANAPLLLSNPQRSPIHDKVLELFRSAGVNPGPVTVLTGTWLSEAEQLSIQFEQAICFVTKSTRAQMKNSWVTVALDEPNAFQDVYIVWRKTERSQAVLDFLDCVRTFFKKDTAHNGK